MLDHEQHSRSYPSRSGYRMWGGTERPANDVSVVPWVSFALVVGVALAIGAWFAIGR